jgi:succinylglutamate desuccinylase
LHTAIRGSRYRQFALLPAREGEYDAGFYALLQASAMDAIVRHTEPGGTFTHFTSEKFGAQSATLELGKVMAFGENDLRLFAATDATVRADCRRCAACAGQSAGGLFSGAGEHHQERQRFYAQP